MPKRSSPDTSHQAGFSLIEVLISILVLALGVIGAAGMQLSALRTGQQTSHQSDAVRLASELADTMRASAAALHRDDASNPFLKIDYRAATDGLPDTPGKLCYAESCNAEELADFDIYQWKARLHSALPSARAMVCRDVEPWDGAQHALAWACEPGAAAGSVFVIKLGWQGKNPDGKLIRDDAKRFPPSVVLAVEPYVK